MKTSDFDYLLPAEAIAQAPAQPRDACRLAVLDRRTHALEHARFNQLGRFLKPGDCLVVNDSRVMSCRVPCRKEAGGASVEVLLLKPLAGISEWECLLKPARRIQAGGRLACLAADGAFDVLEKTPEGTARVRWVGREALDEATLARIGLPPLPPYIQRDKQGDPRLAEDRELYQTVYARQSGSAAAPTAGLHFTPELLASIQAAGVDLCRLTLHVGLGTFLPVKEEDLENHHMHEEAYHVDEAACRQVADCRKRGGRVIAVGTTSLRVLESAASPEGRLVEGAGRTRLFIRPGYNFKLTDGLITNFHVPKSTLLMLVSAFYGREPLLSAYRNCLLQGYRFLSYGDAMFLA